MNIVCVVEIGCLFDQMVSLLFRFGVTMRLREVWWDVSESKVRGLWVWLRRPPMLSSTLFLLFIGHWKG